jgi:hypothetical protein
MGSGFVIFLGITPIASYYRMSIAQVAIRIGTTTQNVLDFLESKTARQLIGNDIQGLALLIHGMNKLFV